MIKRINRFDIVGMIGIGLIVTVKFIKKDGSERVLTGRMGVHKHTVGGVRTSDPREYMMLWETNNADGLTGKEVYRNVSIARLLWAKIAGVTYVPDDIEIPTDAVDAPAEAA